MIIGIDCSRAFGKDRTGTENYSYQVITHLLQLPTARTHHFVLFVRPNSVIPDRIRVSYVEVVVIPFKYLWTQAGLAEATWQHVLDVLWIPAHTLPVLRKPGLKTVVTIHGLEYKWLPEYKNILQRWYLPLSTFYAAKYATTLIAVSDFTKRQLVNELKVLPEKIQVIYEGIGVNTPFNHHTNTQKDKFLEKWGISQKQYILFVGTVQPRKNLVSLIKAFGQLAQKYPDYKLVIAGARGWMTQDIFRAPSTYGVEEKVIFTGRVDDGILAGLYSQASLYVQPSWQEGFGLPVLEAMQAGVSVVTSDGGALPEVVGTAGVVVRLSGAKFAARLAKAIGKILAEPAKRDALIKAGYERTRQFSWTESARKTLQVLTKPI